MLTQIFICEINYNEAYICSPSFVSSSDYKRINNFQSEKNINPFGKCRRHSMCHYKCSISKAWQQNQIILY